MLTLLLILAVIAAILLVLIILAQNPKGGGLSASFGGSMTSNIMGVRQTTDFLEKATWYIAIGIMVIVLGSNFFLPERTIQNEEEGGSMMQEQIDDMPQPIAPQSQELPQGPQDQQGE